MRQQVAEIGPVVRVAIIRVWSGDHMSDTVGGRHAAHLDRDLPGLWAIVDFGDQMGVDINHGSSDLNRLREKEKAPASGSENCRACLAGQPTRLPLRELDRAPIGSLRPEACLSYLP